MKLIKGKVSGLSQETQIKSASTSGNQFSSTTRMHSQNEVHFRIDNQPIHFKFDQTINVMDGEEIAVVGEDKKGIFRAYALKNVSTGVTYAVHFIKLVISLIMGSIIEVQT